ncbi:MAG: 1-acyl-sn-glycerol-3-phosphate acyltransferase [Actinomycetota bacterium]
MLRRLAVVALRLRGWRLSGGPPDLRKYLIVFAPHTCNWDLLLGLLTKVGFGLKASWLAKEAIFRWPIAGFLRHLGGIPVRRDHHEGLVGQVVAAYAAADSLVVGMTPEGTRSLTPYWKSGFYYIALGAGIPIVPASIDLPTRRIALGPALELSGDPHRDMEAIRFYYANVQGIHPEKASPVRLREEAGPPERT